MKRWEHKVVRVGKVEVELEGFGVGGNMIKIHYRKFSKRWKKITAQEVQVYKKKQDARTT